MTTITEAARRAALRIVTKYNPHFDGTSQDDSDARYGMTKDIADAIIAAYPQIAEPSLHAIDMTCSPGQDMRLREEPIVHEDDLVKVTRADLERAHQLMIFGPDHGPAAMRNAIAAALSEIRAEGVAAVRAEREACCKAICINCRDGVPILEERYHYIGDATSICEAAAIRARKSP